MVFEFLFGAKKPSALSISSVNDIVNQSIMKFTPSTISTTSGSNYIEVGSGSEAIGNVQVLNVTSKLKSLYNVSQSLDFKTNVNNDIQQNLEKKTVALLSDMGSMFTNKNVDMNTTIKNSISNLSIFEVAPVCISNQNLVNSIVVQPGGKANYNTQTISSNFLTECMATVNNNMSTSSELVNLLNQKATLEESNPLDFLGTLSANFMIMFVILLIAVIVYVWTHPEQAKKLAMLAATKGKSAG